MSPIGVQSSATDRFLFDWHLRTEKPPKTTFNKNVGESHFEPEMEEHDLLMLSKMSNSGLKDWADKLGVSANIESSPFVRIQGENGQPQIVKKSSLVWFLENGADKLSNDRLRRFVTTSRLKRQQYPVMVVSKCTVRITDWCVFLKHDSDQFLVGRVLRLSFLTGSKELSKEINEYEPGTHNVGALCLWYEFEYQEGLITGFIKPIPIAAHGYHDFVRYICSVPSPSVTSDRRAYFPPFVTTELLNFMNTNY